MATTRKIHGWTMVSTERCVTCRVFMAESELVRCYDGAFQCVGCRRTRPRVSPVASALEWERPLRAEIPGAVKKTALAVGLVVSAFFVAAGISQLLG